MAFTLYRLSFDDPLTFFEQLGDPVATQGGAPVPALRSALRHSVSVATFNASGAETVETRLRLRRQFRSLANNTPMKLTGFYLSWDVDPEQDGWYLPDQGQLVDIDGSSGLATGVFKVENFVWILAGRPRTHRRAMWVYLKDLRTGLWARDFRRVIYSTDFSGLSTVKLSYFAPGVSDLVATGSGAVAAHFLLPAGEDGSQCTLAMELLDLARVSYEQEESKLNKGQLIVYDRRGEQTGPTTGPGTAWEEFYGPDYPYSWLGPSAATIDTPVLDNGRCRVRWDTAHGSVPGWIVDVWTGTAWEEQGKMCVLRVEEGKGQLDEVLYSASLVEYGETRAVLQAVMKGEVLQSREEVFITLERGWSGPRFEVYPGLNAVGERVDAGLVWTIAAADSDDSAVKIDAAGAGVIQATAKGTGHTGQFVFATLGAASFTGENEVILGRWGAAYGLTIAVCQAGLRAFSSAGSTAYGSLRNEVEVVGTGGLGYAMAQLGFPEQHAQQAMEANSMTLGSGTASTADAECEGGKSTTATRTTDANAHVTQATWPNGDYATYRVFARVKTSASTLKIYAKTAGTTGATVTTASTSYVWRDLGAIVTANGTLEIHCWAAAAATVSVDRIEAFLLEDRDTGHGGIYEGGRDRGAAVLTDSRTIPTIVTRSA